MRESFEVLDSSNSGTVNAAAVADMLEQMGMDNSTLALKDFFSPNAPTQLNLARYLDILSAPLADLSHNDELTAAFEAWDVDDSGQIDVIELRAALLHTAADPGEAKLGEQEVDSILGEFASRRHFGGKGLTVAKGKGEVFRYKDFMASVSGGGMAADYSAEGTVGA
jgi:Ca2+-binding EF-hand superfamily protein